MQLPVLFINNLLIPQFLLHIKHSLGALHSIEELMQRLLHVWNGMDQSN